VTDELKTNAGKAEREEGLKEVRKWNSNFKSNSLIRISCHYQTLPGVAYYEMKTFDGGKL